MNEDQQAQDLFDHRNDDDEWDDEPVAVNVRPKSEVVSFRLPRDEMDRLERYLEEHGETLSAFMREAIEVRLEGVPLPSPSVRVAPAASMALTVHTPLSSTWTESPGSWVPDEPPELVSMVGADRSSGRR